MHMLKYILENTNHNINVPNLFAKMCGLTNDINIIEYLIKKHNCDPNGDNNNALRSAIICGNLKIIKYLIKTHECNPSGDYLYDDETSIILAIRTGNIEIVKYLVEEHNCNVHYMRDSAMKWACVYGYLDIVKYLIEEHNCKLKFDEFGNSEYFMHLEIAKYLIETCNYDPCLYDVNMMEDACARGKYEIVKYLIEEQNYNHSTDNECGLKAAIVKNNYEIVKYLIDSKKCEINIDNGEILYLAMQLCDFKIVKYLMENGANIELVNDNHKDDFVYEFEVFNPDGWNIDSIIDKYSDVMLSSDIKEYVCKSEIDRIYKIHFNNNFVDYLLTKEININKLHEQLEVKLRKKLIPFITNILDNILINDVNKIVCGYI